MNVQCHDLLGVDTNCTNSPLGKTNTDELGNAKVNNQGRVCIRQDNTNKDDRTVIEGTDNINNKEIHTTEHNIMVRGGLGRVH